jgi:hypothetical protein
MSMLITYSIRGVAPQVIMLQAKFNIAMNVSGSFSRRTSIRRNATVPKCATISPPIVILAPCFPEEGKMVWKARE